MEDDCCKWEGISCDNLTGHVTSLDIQDPDYSGVVGDLNKQYSDTTPALGGEIDSSICELQHLAYLNVGYNELEGKIPSCIGSFVQLIELKLAFNDFVSVIPPTMGNLSRLETLDLRNNSYLFANNLEWLSQLSNLTQLYLSSVNLSRAVDWPSSISKIPSLSELYLDKCSLPQVNPESIPHINFSTSLKILNLSGNQLNSSILSWVLKVSTVLTHLYLSHNSLHSIPDGFAHMISLQYLSLSHNELEGTIPKSFQNLCQLKELWLYSNKLSGQLSDNVRQLCCAQNVLQVLDLSDNPFNSGPLPDLSCFSSLDTLYLGNTNVVGSLPQSFGHLHNLARLDLSFNKLSGSKPLFEVTKHALLADLDLSHNQLNGTLPCTIGQLSSLQNLFLSSNKLNGVISEEHLFNLSSLTILDVSQNSLSFNLSSNWIPPFQLSRLYASSCILGPKFPTWLKQFGKLEVLQISNNSISDSFPKWFWSLYSSASYLNISHNKLSGTLPKSLPRMETKFPSTWDFSFNNLSGPLPHFPELYALFLSNNKFSGSLSSFCSSSPMKLTYLDLSSNLLAGPLSNCWGNFQSLRVLNLAENSLSGRIPESFGTLRQIESMHLNNNNFSGEIPSLTHCSLLIFIDFGDNNLHGTLPEWVGHHLHYLTILRLRANKFQGNIPASLCNLLFLQVLDLSKNNITGKIPQCLNNITALSNMKFPRKDISYVAFPLKYVNNENGLFNDKTILAWKGDNRDYGKILGLMKTIDLSCNHLTGEIPQSITKLVALASLNLSRNNHRIHS